MLWWCIADDGAAVQWWFSASGRADVYANCLTNSFENSTFSQGEKKILKYEIMSNGMSGLKK